MTTAPTLTPSGFRGRADYPSSDGKPMAETDLHRQIMMDLIAILDRRFAADPMVYVSGDLLLFYEEGNKRKHVAPDVFVVLDVEKRPLRENYILWDEGKGPDVVVEVTSKTTRKEDQTKKLVLYRDVLHVPEYFQFDPKGDYLRPSLQGHRLVAGDYVAIEPVDGRLPSERLGLHLERDGELLRLHDPTTGRWLPTPAENDAALHETEVALLESEAIRRRQDEEIARLRRELEKLRGGGPS